jgi:catechol 2,3-dioxygenase-like lactoylglutathione lyase family enzyme
MHSAVPTFLVPDVAATVKWYTEELGFNATGLFPDTPPHAYASVMRGRAEIMLLSLRDYQKPDLSATASGRGLDAYIRMDGVHALFEQWKDRSFILRPLKQMPYQDWEFDVKDPNGYILVFGGSY